MTDGSWLSVKFTLLDPEGRPYALGGISTDITDRKRAEAAARDARDEAERANEAKSEFLSRMSHELRTPLNAILGFGQLLALEQLEAEAQARVEHILRAGHHLLELINEVLDITRIEAGGQALSLEPVHCCDPLVDALELVRPLAVERGIELASDMHGGLHRYVLADSQRLKQVALNLLSNAIKYNRPDGLVRTYFRESEPGRLRLLVVDTGPGLDAEAAERVFLPFERLSADSTDIEGTGLGLTLSRSLAQAMGGSVGIAHTAPGEGSAFYVELPLVDRPLPPAAESAALIAAAAHVGSRRGAHPVCRGQPLEPRAGREHPLALARGRADPGDCRDRWRSSSPLGMIPMSCCSIWTFRISPARRCSACSGPTAARSAIPVIVLSADATPAQLTRMQNEGIVAYLTKPLDIGLFLDTLRVALAHTAVGLRWSRVTVILADDHPGLPRRAGSACSRRRRASPCWPPWRTGARRRRDPQPPAAGGHHRPPAARTSTARR